MPAMNAKVTLDSLPEELCMRLFSFLSAQDLEHLRILNRRLYRLTGDSGLWSRLYREKFFARPLLPDSDNILTFVDDRKTENVWRKSYILLSKGVHLFPEDNTYECITAILARDPNAIIFLHPGYHVLNRPLRITGSPRILGIGSTDIKTLQNQVRLDVKLGRAEFCLASPTCSAQLSFLTIGFKQIGHARSPLHISHGARPTLHYCNFINTSKLGWALVVSGASTTPHVKWCSISDGCHNGLLLLEAGGLFEENDFGFCTVACLKLVGSSAVFANNWIRPNNKIKESRGQGRIGGVVVAGRSHVVNIEEISDLMTSNDCRPGWQQWRSWQSEE